MEHSGLAEACNYQLCVLIKKKKIQILLKLSFYLLIIKMLLILNLINSHE